MKTIIEENRNYWTGRAPGYSEVNRQELSSRQYQTWQKELMGRIRRHYPHRLSRQIRILEVGTGPGFFAIILAAAGCRVTAVDLTPAMLEQARENAGALAAGIEFLEMNAEALQFPDNSFDVVVTRNLTWNLPHPETAYAEWHRVLCPGGLLLNYDANWYRYLYDEGARKGYEADRRNTAGSGYKDENIGSGFDVMEDIARRVPLSGILRPAWDLEVLRSLGFVAEADTGVWKNVWSEEEKVNFASTPGFLIKAVKT